MFFLLTFCVALFVQLYFYLFLFRKYAFYTPARSDLDRPKVSIVICAKNEEASLNNLLSELSRQAYPTFEIILVNDGSSDNTLSVMRNFQKQARTLTVKIVDIYKENAKGKKNALSLGIEKAENEILLMTDADCIPASVNWIAEMVSSYQSKTEIVLGYGGYHKIKASFLNKLIRFETVLTAMQYFSYALDHRAYMGVGRNLSYRKKAFEKNSGFSSHLEIMSGDDDLFVSEVASRENVSICDFRNSFTLSRPNTSFSAWIQQKKRHITTAASYKSSHQRSLGLFYLSQFSFYVFAVLSLIFESYPILVLSLIFLRFLIWYLIFTRVSFRLNEKDLICLGPLYEISIIFIQLYLFLSNRFSPPKHW